MCRAKRERARRMLKIGIPSAMQGLFRNGSGVVFLKLVALTAAPITAVAAYSIGNQMGRIVRRTSLAFGTAATTMSTAAMSRARTGAVAPHPTHHLVGGGSRARAARHHGHARSAQLVSVRSRW